MDILVQTYLIYLAICVPVILLVGWTLHRNGRVFLVEIFDGKEDLADSINHLFIVGFYLASAGFVSFLLRINAGDFRDAEPVTTADRIALANTTPADAADMIEALSVKIGMVLLVLGAVHLMNLALLAFARKQVLLAGLAPRVELFQCPSCSNPTPANQSFCTSCGRRVGTRGVHLPVAEPNAEA